MARNLALQFSAQASTGAVWAHQVREIATGPANAGPPEDSTIVTASSFDNATYNPNTTVWPEDLPGTYDNALLTTMLNYRVDPLYGVTYTSDGFYCDGKNLVHRIYPAASTSQDSILEWIPPDALWHKYAVVCTLLEFDFEEGSDRSYRFQSVVAEDGASLSMSNIFIGWFVTGIPPLRLTQRNDGLGIAGHARLNVGVGNNPSSIQSAPTLRLGGANTYV